MRVSSAIFPRHVQCSSAWIAPEDLSTRSLSNECGVGEPGVVGSVVTVPHLSWIPSRIYSLSPGWVDHLQHARVKPVPARETVMRAGGGERSKQARQRIGDMLRRTSCPPPDHVKLFHASRCTFNSRSRLQGAQVSAEHPVSSVYGRSPNNGRKLRRQSLCHGFPICDLSARLHP